MNLPKNNYGLICLLLLLFLASSVWSSEEKERWKVHRIELIGNDFIDSYRIKKGMLTRPSRFLARNWYHHHIFAEDLKSILQLYQNNGYLEAQITDTLIRRNYQDKSLDIQITIEEGERTIVEGIAIFDNQVFSDSLLLGKVTLKKGDPFRRKKVEESALAMLTYYANNGYLDAEILPDIRINTESHLALIDFQITEGIQFSIGDIKILSAETTRLRVIQRELKFASGDIVTHVKLLESQRALYLTGLFESVFIRPIESVSGDSTKKDILIELKENDSIELNASLGYGTVEKARAKLGLYHNNIFGTGRKFGLVPRVSFIYRGVEASYTEPWTFGTRWKTDMNFLMDFTENPGYNQRRTAGGATVGRSFGQYSSISLTFRNELSKLSDIKVTPVPEELNVFIRSLKLSPIYDSRDNLFNAKKGVYLEWSNELAGSFLGGSDTFLRSIWRIKGFYPFRRNTVLGSAMEIGWMDHFQGSDEIPLNERFYAGGPNSLRGFGYQLVGPLDTNRTPIGGQFKFDWNVLEIRQTIYKMIGAAFFIDAGNVWWNVEDFAWEDFRYSPGFGLRVNTPIGIVRTDFGFNPHPKSGEEPMQFYFSVGQSF